MTQPQAQRILVVRNDKLGDFMLAWPALACLKQAHPGNHISVLVPGYTAPLARACPWIDEVIVDPGDKTERAVQRVLLAQLRQGNYDALLTLYSTPRIGWLGWRSGIPQRLAPATKWAQIFYNHRITQRRSRSRKPEYRYNLELAGALLTRLGQQPPDDVHPPYWPLPEGTRTAQRERLAKELGLDTARPWVFVHRGSGGSAVNLASLQYASLATAIDRRMPAEQRPIWVLTAGPGEEPGAERLQASLSGKGLDAYRLPARDGLEDFALSLAAADLFIAGSTGPLHIAGCLNVPTAGFYPAKRSSPFTPPADAEQTDMSRIDLGVATNDILALLLSQPRETRS
ncbi:glycosyltransferase family 9 protein [Litchfieldella xinjiangensis]|uniref:glycosyltransferase family 9 protein n=1 Tax=Litchfieldella xinjiangensis TaxID=1166948 RepID=UPI0005B96457|nr:glycosyltransferase family 9 protein [Halomonas xinjiangensis]